MGGWGKWGLRVCLSICDALNAVLVLVFDLLIFMSSWDVYDLVACSTHFRHFRLLACRHPLKASRAPSSRERHTLNNIRGAGLVTRHQPSAQHNVAWHMVRAAPRGYRCRRPSSLPPSSPLPSPAPVVQRDVPAAQGTGARSSVYTCGSVTCYSGPLNSRGQSVSRQTSRVER